METNNTNENSSNIKKITNYKFTREDKKQIEIEIFSINLIKFRTLFFLLTIFDFLSLLFYTFLFLKNKNYFNFLVFINFKLFINFFTLMFLNFLEKNKSISKDNNKIAKNIFLLFSILCFIIEITFFILSPKTFTEWIRILFFPFVLGGFLVIHPKNFYVLSIIIFILEFIISFAFLKSFYTNKVVAVFLNISIPFITFVLINLYTHYNYYIYLKTFINKKNLLEFQSNLILKTNSLYETINKDNLTNLYSRIYFEGYLDSLWENHNNNKSNIVMIILDVDYMKRYNKTFGNPKGDEILVLISKTILNIYKPFEYEVFRIEGDEFAIVASVDDETNLLALTKNVLGSIENLKIENPNSNTNAYLTLSAGVAIFKFTKNLVQKSIIYQAYNSLEYAKENRGNRLVLTIGENNNYLDENLKSIEDYIIKDKDFKRKISSHVINKLNIDTLFLYSKSTNTLEFSKQATNIFNLPKTISNPSLEKVANYIKPEEREKFINLLKSNFNNKINDILIDTKINTIKYDDHNIVLIIKCIYKNNVLDTLSGYVMMFNDVIKFNRYLENEAQIDSLTQLPNRRKFYDDMDLLLETKSEYGFLVLLDINNFKSINNIYSHNIGDKVLGKLGELLKVLSNKEGNIYSYSIDQFIIIFRHYDYKKTQEFMNNIQDYFNRESMIVDDLNIRINFSMSAVGYEVSKKKTDELMIDLDITITKVKYESRTGYAFFKKEDKANYLDKVSLEKKLTMSVENNFIGFYLYYQPIFDSKTKVCVGAEALLRWNNNHDSIVSPSVFVPILEMLGHMEKVEKWVINSACNQCRKWLYTAVNKDFFIHINLSPLTIKRKTLISEIMNGIKENNIEIKNIRLEVTETSVLREMKSSINILKKLREYGFKIAVDDFGIGYSALSYLNSLPIDEIKIDKSFLDEIGTNPSSAELLKSIANMAKSMGFLVCVEGIETKSHEDFLNELNIDYLQGFYYAKPLPPNVLFNKFILSK